MRAHSPNQLSRQIQALENRWCPASTITVDHGIMKIIGDNEANIVTISHDGAGQVVAVGDGTTVTADGIKRIIFDLKSGDDSVTVNTTGELTKQLDLRMNFGDGDDSANLKFASISRNLTVSADLGAGDDWIDLNLDEEIRSGVAIGLDVRGYDGADTWILSVNEVRPNAILRAHFDGDDGDDVLDVRLGDPIDSGARVKIDGDGGDGADLLKVDGVTMGIGAIIQAGAHLRVNLCGDDGDDTVELKAAGVSGDLKARVDLGDGDDAVNMNMDWEIRAGGEVRLDVRGRDGADTMDLNVNHVLVNADLRVRFDGDDGDDAFHVCMGDPIESGARVSIDACGGDGDDSLALDATSFGLGGDIGAGGKMTLKMNGGDGDDTILATYEGDVDGELSIQLDGDRGNDLVNAEVSASAGSNGKVKARIDGCDGNDSLTLMLFDLSAGSADVFGLIDGGRGFDVGVGTPNVVKKHCEA
jgi:hypothetical protein